MPRPASIRGRARARMGLLRHGELYSHMSGCDARAQAEKGQSSKTLRARDAPSARKRPERGIKLAGVEQRAQPQAQKRRDSVRRAQARAERNAPTRWALTLVALVQHGEGYSHCDARRFGCQRECTSEGTDPGGPAGRTRICGGTHDQTRSANGSSDTPHGLPGATDGKATVSGLPARQYQAPALGQWRVCSPGCARATTQPDLRSPAPCRALRREQLYEWQGLQHERASPIQRHGPDDKLRTGARRQGRRQARVHKRRTPPGADRTRTRGACTGAANRAHDRRYVSAQATTDKERRKEGSGAAQSRRGRDKSAHKALGK